MSGFEAVADDLARLDRVRILVGRTDRQVFEEVAVGLQQTGEVRSDNTEGIALAAEPLCISPWEGEGKVGIPCELCFASGFPPAWLGRE